MNIAILSTIENYSWAGTEEVWYQFAKIALDDGHKVVLLSHQKVARHHKVKGLKEKGLKVIERNPFRPTRLYLLKERFWSDTKDFQQFGADVLLINSGSLLDVLNLKYVFNFVQKVKVPKFFFCHFVAELLKPSVPLETRKFLNGMDQVIFVSDHNKGLAERQLALRLPDSKVLINSSKVLLEEPLEFPDNDTIQMACVARFETLWKGQDVLLEVLSSPKWQERNWHLNLYGTGPDHEYIEELIKMYSLNAQVTIHGYVEDIVDVWKQNHLMVLTSRGEGTPLAVLEAMMCGRPTVTTDVGGNREILDEGETGWIADVAVPNVFDSKLEEAWKQRSNWPEMGEAAHNAAKSIFKRNPSKELLNLLIQRF